MPIIYLSKIANPDFSIYEFLAHRYCRVIKVIRHSDVLFRINYDENKNPDDPNDDPMVMGALGQRVLVLWDNQVWQPLDQQGVELVEAVSSFKRVNHDRGQPAGRNGVPGQRGLDQSPGPAAA